MYKYIVSSFVLLTSLIISGFLFAQSHNARAADVDHIMILFDVSGSMKEKLGGGILSEGTAKYKIARDSVKEVVDDIDDSVEVGLRAFGTKDTIDQELKCTATELLVPLGTDNDKEIKSASNKLIPRGATPMVYALGVAKDELKDLDGTKKIILIGDGKETCDGNVQNMAEELKDLDIPIDSIYLGDDLSEGEDLKLASDVSGGTFNNAGDAESFSDALDNAIGSAGSADSSTGAGADLVSEHEVENFENTCKAPAKVGDQVLYQEYDFEQEKQKKETTGLEVILDFSGSMEGKVSGKTKIDVARDALGTTLGEIPEGIETGFRVYGHSISKDNKEASCVDTDLLVKFDNDRSVADTAAEIISSSKLHAPLGWTPIEHALNEAVKDLEKYDNKLVLLISDGEETCGGDPVGRMEQLKIDGVEVTVHTVGFDVDAATAAQLKAISEKTGGKYVDAGSSEELEKGVGHVIEEGSREVHDCPPAYTNPVKGGADLDSAVEVEPGTYTLDKHLERKDFYYYKVPVKSGQLVKIFGTTQAPGVKGSYDEEFEELPGTLSTFNIKVYDENKEESRKRDPILMNEKGPEKQVNIAALQDGYVYLEVGYGIGDVHKDSLFSIQIEDHFDGDTNADSNKEDRVTASETFTGGLGFEDVTDYINIPRELTGQKIVFNLNNEKFKGHLQLFGDDGKLISDAKSEGTVSLNLPKDDGLQLVIEDVSTIDAESEGFLSSKRQYAAYSVSFEKSDGETEARSEKDNAATGSATKKSGLHWGVYAGIGLLILILLILALVLLLKNKKPEDVSASKTKKKSNEK